MMASFKNPIQWKEMKQQLCEEGGRKATSAIVTRGETNIVHLSATHQ